MAQDTGPLPLLGHETQPSQPIPIATTELAPAEAGRIARAAVLIAIGSLFSRMLGLIRETVKANLFGATGMVSALEAATLIPNTLYNLFIGGIISSVLVPVFSEYTPRGRRDDLWYLTSALMTVVTLFLVVLVLVSEVFASWVVKLPIGGLEARFLQVGAQMLRVSMPAVIFMTLSGILTALLYALKRFTLPAFTAVAVNVCVVGMALLFGRRWGVMSMAVGLLVGAVAQVLLQLPGLRDAHLRPVFNLNHPGLRRIGQLYVPLLLSLVVSEVAAVLSFNLASHTGEEGVAWMRYAAQLIQLPLGLVAMTVSWAILPTLSQQAQTAVKAVQDGLRSRRQQMPRNELFLSTLAQGLKMVLIFTVPATVGLFVLSQPVVALIFQHGDFGLRDTVYTAEALRFALLGLIFAAIDWPLNFAFYAHQDTLTPALVGVAAVGIYLLVALVPTLFGPLTLNGLILANSVQLASHALIMMVLLQRRMGRLQSYGLGRFLIKAVVSSLGMGGVTWVVAQTLSRWFPDGRLLGELLVVGGSALVGLAVYVALMVLLRADSGELVQGLLRRRRSPPAS